MRIKLILCLLVTACNLMALAPEGIPHDLARTRADRISNVRYHLQFTLIPHAESTAGREELQFTLSAPGDLLIDFREGAVATLSVNGGDLTPKIENGHIVLPESSLRIGENSVVTDFTVPVATAGKAITRFNDTDDNTEYIYTLFVPMDAEMAFPCFDQPDLKGRFHLEVTAPESWTVISNTAIEKTVQAGTGQRHTFFDETHPISTYLFAFAAGPFRKVHESAGMPGVYVRQSRFKQAAVEAPAVQQIVAQGIHYLSEYFAQPFPFAKYDMVLIPGFAYGGMEHAGATFIREESVLFRTAPTHDTYLGRDILLLHELTHQWFGDFTTMRWFDDLWLKEGFAQYMAYRTLAELKPDDDIWKHFYQDIKPGAYAIDSTKGTTPIYQEIANLKDAKSAYGEIVYDKAPGVIKQLAFVLGERQFRNGLRVYLKEHAYGNAEWSDLVRALERTSGKPLQDWAAMWIRHRGMPQVDVTWSCDSSNRIDQFFLMQHNVLGEGGMWPIATQLLLDYKDHPALRLRVDFNAEKAGLPQLIGKPCPQYVFANDRDYAYGRFLLDARSSRVVPEQLSTISDVFQRTLLWGSLWNSVREAQFPPRQYLELALRLLPAERDEALTRSLIGRVTTGLHYYVNPEAREELLPKAEALASDRMLHSAGLDLRILWFHELIGIAESTQGRAQLKDLLNAKLTVPELELRPLDRWSIVGALISLNDPEADAVMTAEQKRDSSGDGLKYAYMVQAARPDSKSKQDYFNDYLHNPSRPEDWTVYSLGYFNYWSQSDLSLPYLKPALDALPQLKRERKIFFVLNWLNAFIDGQQSVAAQAQVHEFLNSASIDQDLRLKVLEVSDELDRTVKIRQTYK